MLFFAFLAIRNTKSYKMIGLFCILSVATGSWDTISAVDKKSLGKLAYSDRPAPSLSLCWQTTLSEVPKYLRILARKVALSLDISVLTPPWIFFRTIMDAVNRFRVFFDRNRYRVIDYNGFDLDLDYDFLNDGFMDFFPLYDLLVWLK